MSKVRITVQDREALNEFLDSLTEKQKQAFYKMADAFLKEIKAKESGVE